LTTQEQENISIYAGNKIFPCYTFSSTPFYFDCSSVTILQFQYMRQRNCVPAEQWTGFTFLIANLTSRTLHTYRAPRTRTVSLYTQFDHVRHLTSHRNQDTLHSASDIEWTWTKSSPCYQ